MSQETTVEQILHVILKRAANEIRTLESGVLALGNIIIALVLRLGGEVRLTAEDVEQAQSFNVEIERVGEEKALVLRVVPDEEAKR